jgi:hypothetical protein
MQRWLILLSLFLVLSSLFLHHSLIGKMLPYPRRWRRRQNEWPVKPLKSIEILIITFSFVFFYTVSLLLPNLTYRRQDKMTWILLFFYLLSPIPVIFPIREWYKTLDNEQKKSWKLQSIKILMFSTLLTLFLFLCSFF